MLMGEDDALEVERIAAEGAQVGRYL